MRLTITVKNQIKVLSWTLYVYLGCLIFMVYKNNYFITLGMNLFFFVINIPLLILHFKYFLIGKSKVYFIEKDKIIIEQKDKIIKIEKGDIVGIKLVKPANLDDGWNIHFLGITYYYYLSVNTKKGESYIITNLLHPKIDKVFEDYGYSFYREKRFGWI